MNSNFTADDVVRLFRSEAARRNGTAATAERAQPVNLPRARDLPSVRELSHGGAGRDGNTSVPAEASAASMLREWIEQIHSDLVALRNALQPLTMDLQMRANDLTEQLHRTRQEAMQHPEAFREIRWNLLNVTADVSTMAARLENVHGTVARISNRTAQVADANDRLASATQANADALAAAQTTSIAALGRVEDRVTNDAVYIKAQLSRLRAMLDEIKRPVSKAKRAGKEPAAATTATDGEIDAFYLAFENAFRGTRAEINQRLRVYLPFLAAVDSEKQRDFPVLDLGCGRGEWLELLTAAGFPKPRGVDLNASMVEQCTLRGLDAIRADALEHLRSADDDSYAAITSYHLIEHLPFRALLEFVRQILRVLRPGGVTILETPNPRNILVGASDFFRDMTHNHPIHPDTIRFTLETSGFAEVRCYFLRDAADGRAAIPQEDFVFSDLQSYVDVPRDYAVVARKA
jgi:O-antigen chain-terminating methyltransferase